MQCKCGGSTVVRKQPKVRNKVQIAVVELVVCEACGRVGGGVTMWLTDPEGNKTRQIDNEALKELTKRKASGPSTRKRRTRK